MRPRVPIAPRRPRAIVEGIHLGALSRHLGQRSPMACLSVCARAADPTAVDHSTTVAHGGRRRSGHSESIPGSRPTANVGLAVSCWPHPTLTRWGVAHFVCFGARTAPRISPLESPSFHCRSWQHHSQRPGEEQLAGCLTVPLLRRHCGGPWRSWPALCFSYAVRRFRGSCGEGSFVFPTWRTSLGPGSCDTFALRKVTR